MTIPLLRASYVLDHVTALEDLGYPARALAIRVGLPARVIESPRALVPLTTLDRIIQIAIRNVGHGFAWAAAPRSLEDLGPLGELISGSRSLFAALETFVVAVKAESALACFRLQPGPDRLWIIRDSIPAENVLRTHTERINVLILLLIIRHFAGPGWIPDELSFGTGPIPEDDRLEARRIRFGCRTFGMAVSNDVLLCTPPPLPSRVGTLQPLLDLDELGLVDAMKGMLRGFLVAGHVPVQQMAKLLHMSPRSLQRRLDAAGTTYTRIVNDVRLEMAIARLEHSNLSITEIAHELGYSDSAHFARAFRRWTGLGPRDYRALRRAG